MGMRIVMVEAGSGDCFLIEVDAPGGVTRRLLIDGGPPGTPKRALQSVLRQRGPEPVSVDLLAVTHIDSDHIGGAIDLLQATRYGQPVIRPASVWHNSFEVITGDRVLVGSPILQRRVAGRMPMYARVEDKECTTAVVASISQGVTLADLIREQRLAGNQPVNGPIVRGVGPYEWTGGPKVQILGPDPEDLERLRRQWETQVNQERNADKLALYAAANIDQSVTNKSSMVLLVEHDSRRVLLTGDSRGDLIVKQLKAAGHLRRGPLEVSALKVQHHGSDRSCDQGLFNAVVADHYLISGDGTHGNPAPETAKRLVNSLRGRVVHVWLSHDVPAVTRILRGHTNVTVHVLAGDSVTVEL